MFEVAQRRGNYFSGSNETARIDRPDCGQYKEKVKVEMLKVVKKEKASGNNGDHSQATKAVHVSLLVVTH